MRILGSLLVGFSALLALLPFFFALAGQGILLVKLALPHVNGILDHRFVRGLLAMNDGHQPKMMYIAVAIFHLDTIGVRTANGHDTYQCGHVHRDRYAHQRFFQTDWQCPDIDLHARFLCRRLGILDLVRRNAEFERIQNLLHQLRDPLRRLLTSRVDHRFQFRFRKSEPWHHLHQHLFLIVADGSQVHRQLVQLHVALPLSRLAAIPAPPLCYNR